MTPCIIGTSKGKVEGINQNRRVLINGEAWNTWLLKSSQKAHYPAEGPADAELGILAVIDKNERYKAILYNFACHPVSTSGAMISADYPGHVQKYVEKHLGYEVPTLFLLGSCGNVNTRNSNAIIGKKIGEEIFESLTSIELIAKPTLCIESQEMEMPAREQPKFQEKEISRKWPGQLEHYRKAFDKKKQQQNPTYKFLINGMKIGDHFAMITNPVELFCEIGLDIKKNSPFSNTMVATLTNGASGYVPTTKAFQRGGYETWFGEHSFLAIETDHVIEKESLLILKQLDNKE